MLSPPFMKVKPMSVGLDHGDRSCVKVTSQFWMVSLGLFMLAGCGGGGPSLIKAKGKIMVDGAPAVGATLLFHPESTTNANVANAIADENGVYAPVTGADEGIAEGNYRVTVVWPDPKLKAASDGPKFGVAEAKEPPDLLKGKFISRERSKLSVSITRSKVELDPLELSTK